MPMVEDEPGSMIDSRALLSAKSKRRKGSRNLLPFAHYGFRSFPEWKAEQRGKMALVVNEAYAGKTCSWTGERISNLGSRKVLTGRDGVRPGQDIIGAHGIFLRTLGYMPCSISV